MSKAIDYDKPDKVRREGWIRKRIVPFLILLLVIAISVCLFYFYRHYPGRIEELKTYGYLGAFVISLIFNATVILPAGSILIISALAATLPSAAVVGLVGGAGAAIGEVTGYMAGYSGRSLVARGEAYSRVKSLVRRWGALTIFVLSLVPLVFDLAGIAAGAIRFPFWKFLLLCWLGRTILYVTFAVLFALGWEAVLPYLG